MAGGSCPTSRWCRWCGAATAYAPALAWYDAINGEIGDICNAEQGTITGNDGVVYTVQTEFSNALNRCIVAPPLAASSDAPLPPWALGAMGVAMIGAAGRRRTGKARLEAGTRR